MLFRNRQPIIPHVYGDKEFSMHEINQEKKNVVVEETRWLAKYFTDHGQRSKKTNHNNAVILNCVH